MLDQLNPGSDTHPAHAIEIKESVCHTTITVFTGTDNKKSLLTPQKKLEKKFGQSPVFEASTLKENGGITQGASSASLLTEAIHVISCGYEDKTEWGKEVN